MVLLERLRRHRAEDGKEAADLRRIVEFVAAHADPFDRRIADAHLTASAFVLSADGTRVLLLRHLKLDRWLQPGGHGDPGEARGEDVALREAWEETGIAGLHLHPAAPRPLDVDVHTVPARGSEPAHFHLDLRYLVVAPADASLSLRAEESSALQWFAWDGLDGLDLDEGLRRGLAKARTFFSEDRARSLLSRNAGTIDGRAR